MSIKKTNQLMLFRGKKWHLLQEWKDAQTHFVRQNADVLNVAADECTVTTRLEKVVLKVMVLWHMRICL
jgi:hypothetical protein